MTPDDIIFNNPQTVDGEDRVYLTDLLEQGVRVADALLLQEVASVTLFMIRTGWTGRNER